MGLVSGKVLIVLLLLFVGTGWALATGGIKWQTDNYKCVFGKHWEKSGDPLVLWTVGKIHFYYQPHYYGCPETDRYNPREFKNEFGNLVPLTTPQAN